MKNDWIYDIETFPNVFTIAFEHALYPIRVSFEISEWINQSTEIIEFVDWLSSKNARMIGFNNLGFDYPVLHMLLMAGFLNAEDLYRKAQAIIDSQSDESENRWAHAVMSNQWRVYQLDLYRIHHFDNRARATSLKSLQFNMRSETIEDLPFSVGTILNQNQTRQLKKYNSHDVSETKKFYHLSLDKIQFREELSKKYVHDFMNHNDTKIGKDYFTTKLQEAGVSCYTFEKGKRLPVQTKRKTIRLADAILPHISFRCPELTKILEFLKSQEITETKNVFKDLSVKIGNIDVFFGLGGIHGSVDDCIVQEDHEYAIVDLDVTSYYPNLAIVNKFYPEHLGINFVHVYQYLFEQRKKYKKGSPESGMLKLALNGVYGDSNNPFSIFYDPLFTMKITLNGQLLLCVLADTLMNSIPGIELIQMNTDGITIKIPKFYLDKMKWYIDCWEGLNGLTLEAVNYSKIFIRDVNNYIAVTEDGKIKRKGAYDWEVDWHQNASALVVQKVAEKVLLENAPIRETVENWPNRLDFAIRAKVPRSSKLVIQEPGQKEPTLIQNVSRYIVSEKGGKLTKWMPPLKNSAEWRAISIESGFTVEICNNIENIDNISINYDYYVEKVEKLCLPLS